jgi:hypothetical protein
MANRQVNVHESDFCKLTDHAANVCELTNNHRRAHPDCTFEELTSWYNHMRPWAPLSKESIRRYYYGLHARNGWGWSFFWGHDHKGTHHRVRYGVKVDI